MLLLLLLLLLGVILSQRGGVVSGNHLNVTFALTASCMDITTVVLCMGRSEWESVHTHTHTHTHTNLLCHQRCVRESPAPGGLLCILGGSLGGNLVSGGLGAPCGVGSGLRGAGVGRGG